MATAFGVSCLGVAGGLVHSIYATVREHRSIEDILGNAISYYRAVGAIGLAGFLLLFAFLISTVTDKKQDKPH